MRKIDQKPKCKDYSDVSSFLKDYRRYLSKSNPDEFSQSAVSKATGLGTPQFLCNIENGRHQPPVDAAIKLAQYYGVSSAAIHELFMKVYEKQLVEKIKQAKEIV